MHLKDENFMRLYLSMWMGKFEIKLSSASGHDAAMVIPNKQLVQEVQKQNTFKVAQSILPNEVYNESQHTPVQTDNISLGRMLTRKTKNTKKKENQKKTGNRNVPRFKAALNENELEFALPDAVWKTIGEEMLKSKPMLPVAFGKAFRDIHKHHAGFKATELVNFMHLVSPIVLYGRLSKQYYLHWHRFVSAAQHCRSYRLTTKDIEEFETDIIATLEGHEKLYYQYQRSRLPLCTTQVHGLVHLAHAMRICGPVAIYHCYPMERVCGFLKPLVHSRSRPNENMASNIVQRERMNALPFIVHQNPDRWPFLVPPHDRTAFLQYVPKNAKLKFVLPDEYPDHMLLSPSETRYLTAHERTRMKEFYRTHIDQSVPSFEGIKFKIWGRAIVGRQLNNESNHELVSSKYAMEKLSGREKDGRRDQTHVRYMFPDVDNVDHSYFGQVLFYTTVQVEQNSQHLVETYMVAYMQYLRVCRVNSLDLAYKLSIGPTEVINITDIQELIGRIYSRGKEFFVSRRSCFWPKEGYVWDRTVDSFL
ncbi:hypothetical protein EDC01DRAFT_628291 [Geopyxis carbonaria]|nr:hypothetical protein EDC01DRAFT_628291 [Geopyxis carbonaria]